jgi:cell division protein FtsB
MDRTKIDEIRQKYEARAREYILGLRDVRNLGSLVFIVIVLLISWSGIKAIQTNFGLQKQVERMKQENAIHLLENQNLQLRNGYYNTSQYLEVSARQNFGLAKPGETVLLVPNTVALAHSIPDITNTADETPSKKLPFWQNNLREWLNFFFHRT